MRTNFIRTLLPFVGLLGVCLLHTAPARGAWLNTSWPKRAELTVDPSKIPAGASFAGVTLLVDLADPSLTELMSSARPDGADLVVTSSDGVSVLPHELVSFDSALGTGELWFRADSLSTNQSTYFLYFGNTDSSVVPDASAAWGSDHLAVYHFEADPSAVSSATDSGPGDGENPASIGSGSTFSSADRVQGKIGKAWDFDGVTDWLRASSISSPDSSFTISAWFADVRGTQEGMTALQSLSEYWDVSFRRNVSNPRADVTTASGGMIFQPLFEDSLMHYHVWTLDAAADTARFFVDGVEWGVYTSQKFGQASHVFERASIQGMVGIAGPVFFNLPDLTNGVVDEFRVVEGVQDPSLIQLQYANQSDPAAFFATTIQPIGVVTSNDPGLGPRSIALRAWPNPSSGLISFSTDRGVPPVELNVYDLAGRLVRSIRSPGVGPGQPLRWNGRDASGAPAASGIYYVRAHDEYGRELTGKVVLRR